MIDSLPSPAPPIPLHPDETIDAIGYGELQIIQPKQGFRFTLDPILLAGFARIKQGESWVDLGTGNGVIPLLLADREKSVHITGVEIDAQSADRARRNLLLNSLEQQIRIIQGDLRELRSTLEAQSYDVVITNPPYRRPESGRISKGDGRSIARHELHGNLDDFLAVSRYLLKNGGRFYAIYLAERLPELLGKMSAMKIEAKRLRCIHSKEGAGANLVLIEGRRNGRPGLTVTHPLYIYDREDYSEEVRRLAGGSL